MAFLTPFFPSNRLTSQRSTSSTQSTRPIRVSSFNPSNLSLRYSPLWRDVLRKSATHPLVIHAPTTASIALDPQPPKILISGAPASGKGTQCEYIVNKYNVVHISTGDMLRAAVKAQTPLGIKAKSFMDAGQLVPDDLVISMLNERITLEDCVQKGWLLDGFPRTAIQAQALTAANILPSAVVVLNVEDDALIDRVVGRRSDPVTGKIYHIKFSPPSDPDILARLTQRSDDTEEKARVRLQTYYTHAQSIHDHYAATLKTVDGNRSKADVFDDISTIIDASIATDRHNGGSGNNSNPDSATALQSDSSAPTRGKGMPVSEFVKKAEEAYETGLLNNEDVNWSGQATADSSDSAGTSTYADLARRLDLVLGDSFALLMFAYVGRAHHGDSSFDLDVLKTAAPFLVAWLGVSPLLGAYTRAATSTVVETAKIFLRSWAIAVPMGIALRGVVTEHVPPAIFSAITLASTLVIVGSWRIAYVKIRGEETDESRRGGPMEGIKMITTLLRRW
eukprot:GFKZ01000190.1.p1 GENE.GFKZ01000190.1~~GFKZ01000190.1.p1  ORF type:complete len:507 (-),score=64.45 GFKZ01000190.1:1051-2571(-)